MYFWNVAADEERLFDALTSYNIFDVGKYK